MTHKSVRRLGDPLSEDLDRFSWGDLTKPSSQGCRVIAKQSTGDMLSLVFLPQILIFSDGKGAAPADSGVQLRLLGSALRRLGALSRQVRLRSTGKC